MTEEQKTLSILLALEAKEALKESEKFRKAVEEIKKSLEDIKKANPSTDIKALAKEFLEATKSSENLKKILKEIKEETGIDLKVTDFEKLAGEDLKKFTDIVKTAQKELTQAQKQEQQNRLTGTKEAINAEMELQKISLEEFRKSSEERRTLEREAATSEQEKIQIIEEQYKKQTEVLQQAEAEYKNAVQERKRLAEELAGAGTEQQQAELEKAKIAEETAKRRVEAERKVTKDIEAEYKKQTQASKQATDSFKLFGVEIKNLGDVAKFVFGSVLGVTAISALRNIIRFLGDAAQAAIDFGKSQFVLELAVRNLRRFGSDVDLSELQEQIAELGEQFQIFSEVQLTAAFAEATNKLSNFGFTAQQVSDVVRAGIVVYTTDLTGRFNSLAQAINGVTNYLVSGYGEALERSGFIAGRAGDKIQAFEQGLAGGLYSLDPFTLALTRFNFIMEQTAEKSEDAQSYIKTLAGEMEAAEARIQDATVKIGTYWDDLLVEMKNAWADFIESINEFEILGTPILDIVFGDQEVRKTQRAVQGLAEEYIKINDEISKIQEKAFVTYEDLKRAEELQERLEKIEELIVEMVDLSTTEAGAIALGGGGFESLAEYLTEIGAGYVTLKPELNKMALSSSAEEYAEFFANEFGFALNSAFSDMQGIGAPMMDAIAVDAEQAAQSMYDNLIDELLKYQQKHEKAEREFSRDLLDIWEEYEEKRAEIIASANEELGDVTTGKIGQIKQDYLDKLAELYAKYAVDVAQTLRQFAIRRAEIERNYRLREKQAERQFQEDMRRLREGFLFDLEDALRERDALQVIRLTRQYSLQKEQSERQFELDKQTRKENYQEELRQLEIQKQERLRQLAEELQLRIAAIQKEREAELAIEEQKHQEDMARLDAWLREKLTALNRSREASEEEMSYGLKNFIDSMILELSQDREITPQWLNNFVGQLRELLGEGGEADKIIDYITGEFEKLSTNVAVTTQLTQSQLASAARYTGQAMEQGQMPGMISPELAGAVPSIFPFLESDQASSIYDGQQDILNKQDELSEKEKEILAGLAEVMAKEDEVLSLRDQRMAELLIAFEAEEITIEELLKFSDEPLDIPEIDGVISSQVTDEITDAQSVIDSTPLDFASLFGDDTEVTESIINLTEPLTNDFTDASEAIPGLSQEYIETPIEENAPEFEDELFDMLSPTEQTFTTVGEAIPTLITENISLPLEEGMTAIHDADLERQNTWLQAKLESFKTHYGEILVETQNFVNSLQSIIVSLFGEDSPIMPVFEAYIEYLKKVVAATRQAIAMMRAALSAISRFGRGGGGSIGNSARTSFASGGTLVATQPTTVTFGETPEIARFVPLRDATSSDLASLMGRQTDRPRATNVAMGAGANNESKIYIQLDTNEYLEAKIVSMALAESAEILFDVVKGSKK